jgi:putative molybdopterin biosynthesis protein
MQCLVYRPDDPRFQNVASVEEFVRIAVSDATCTMVNRNAGSGTRIVIDEQLGTHRPPGYAVQPKSHNAVAAAIQQNRADWGVAIESVAKSYGLAFLPLKLEHYDFVSPQSRMARPAVVEFRSLLQSPQVREQLRALGFVSSPNSLP